ncbi:MAG TPA: response regulator transcription factor [Candidatus Sulfotelmatobacter sp.]|nr:response regulator transcription factor [Candidatus Sulfotelmatobacter sp.]
MRTSKPIRILVVDDHFMVRMGLSASLNVEVDMEVVAEAGNGNAAIDAFRKHRPNLVMMDLRLPGMSGIECTAAILREFADAHILMLSTHSGEEEIYRAMQAGAKGYIVKSVIREELLRAIREVHQGRQYVDPLVASHLADRRSHRSLSAREVEVLHMVAKGLGNKEIANALNIAEVTVKLHVSHVLEKLSVKDRTQAATVALQRGIIALE